MKNIIKSILIYFKSFINKINNSKVIKSTIKNKTLRKKSILFGTIITIYIAIFQLVVLNYELKLNSAITERNSVETLISGNQLALAVRGLARAQKEKVPTKPNLFPLTWFSFFHKPIFKDRLHEEMIVALKEYADTLLYGNKSRLNLSKADLTGAFLDDANMVYALLFQTEMNKIQLNNANLTGAALNDANLKKACLMGARLEKTKLYKTKLIKAKLNRANLSNANLEKANLYKCELDSAIVNKANFYEANLSCAILNNLRSWRNILRIENANIKDVKINSSNPDNNAIGFCEWATSFERGAVEMEVDKWKKWCENKCVKPKCKECWKNWNEAGFPINNNGEPPNKYLNLECK